MKLSYKEMVLLKEMVLQTIGNGNTVNPKPFVPTPEQYKMCYAIMQELEYDIMCLESFK